MRTNDLIAIVLDRNKKGLEIDTVFVNRIDDQRFGHDTSSGMWQFEGKQYPIGTCMPSIGERDKLPKYLGVYDKANEGHMSQMAIDIRGFSAELK